MPSKTKTEITIHTRQTMVVHGLKVRCQQCGAEVSIMTPNLAAAALQKTTHEIDQLIDQGALHPIQETSIPKLICGNSIADESETPAKVDG